MNLPILVRDEVWKNLKFTDLSFAEEVRQCINKIENRQFDLLASIYIYIYIYLITTMNNISISTDGKDLPTRPIKRGNGASIYSSLHDDDKDYALPFPDKVDENGLKARAIVINFTRHTTPDDLYPLLQTKYKYIKSYRPDDAFMYIETDTINPDPINTLVSNPIKKSNLTKSQQIQVWLTNFFTVLQEGEVNYCFDLQGDYYIILPQRDAQLATEIMMALNAISKIDYHLVWSTYSSYKAQFIITEIVSSKGYYLEWKSKADSVTGITDKLKQRVISRFSEVKAALRQNEPTKSDNALFEQECQLFIDSLNPQAKAVLMGVIKKREHNRAVSIALHHPNKDKDKDKELLLNTP